MGETDKLPEAVREALRVKDEAYAERNRLVAALSKVWPAHFRPHEPLPGEEWDPDWTTVVCVHIPGEGVAAWHIHDSEQYLFTHLSNVSIPSCPGLDHDTGEKYARLERFPVGVVSSPLRINDGSDFQVPADRWDREEGGMWIRAYSRHLPVPIATLRQIGWIDQKGRIWRKVPSEPLRDNGGSYSPLLVDCREDGH